MAKDDKFWACATRRGLACMLVTLYAGGCVVIVVGNISIGFAPRIK
jgi:hypothetical protein